MMSPQGTTREEQFAYNMGLSSGTIDTTLQGHAPSKKDVEQARLTLIMDARGNAERLSALCEHFASLFFLSDRVRDAFLIACANFPEIKKRFTADNTEELAAALFGLAPGEEAEGQPGK
jgi:hypothetical protein